MQICYICHDPIPWSERHVVEPRCKCNTPAHIACIDSWITTAHTINCSICKSPFNFIPAHYIVGIKLVYILDYFIYQFIVLSVLYFTITSRGKGVLYPLIILLVDCLIVGACVLYDYVYHAYGWLAFPRLRHEHLPAVAAS